MRALLLVAFTLSSLIMSPLSAGKGKVLVVAPSTVEEGAVDLFLQEPGAPTDKLLVILHGDSTNGFGREERHLAWYSHWVDKGYAVAAISMPGNGGSEGRKDFCGPATLRAIDRAVGAVKEILGSKTIGLIGHGQGSQAALLFAAGREDIRCVVASGAVANLVMHSKKPEDPLIKTIIKKEYAIDTSSEAELIARSPVYSAGRIASAVFVLYREKNPFVSIEEIEEFVSAMREQTQYPCELVVLERTPESEPQKVLYSEILDHAECWIDRWMQ